MGLETATYINDLIETNPTGTDSTSQGDDHLRMIKAVLKNTFSNISGEVTATQDELNQLSGKTLKSGAFGDAPGGQDQTNWNTGTDTTESLISPAKLEAKLGDYISNLVIDQTAWNDGTSTYEGVISPAKLEAKLSDLISDMTYSQADWETGTGTVEGLISPEKLHETIDNHYSTPIAFATWNVYGTILYSKNISSVSHISTGNYVVNFSVSLNQNFIAVFSCDDMNNTYVTTMSEYSPRSSTSIWLHLQSEIGYPVPVNTSRMSIIVYGVLQ